MSIWIYKNRELLHNTSIPYFMIHKEYNITSKTIKKYKDNKPYKEYYFSTHRLNNEELNNIFPILDNGNSNSIDNINIIEDVSISDDINKQILNSINELKEQVKEIRKENIELKEQVNEIRKENIELKEQVKEIQNKYNILEKQIMISRKENKELNKMLVKLLE